MNNNYGNEISYKIVNLTPEYYDLLKKFDCDHGVINEHFRNECKVDTSVITYLFINSINSEILGCASIQCSGIRHEIDENYINTIPAIEIKYFAVLNDCQRLSYSDEEEQHYYFSDELLGALISKCYEISEYIIGAEYIILYSVPQKVNFYKRNLFQEYDRFMKRNRTQEITECIPMYLQL